MSATLEFDAGVMAPFMQSRIKGLQVPGDARFIGLRRGSRIAAGAMYEGFNGHNMWVHLASDGSDAWLNRTFLRAGFLYPFVTCGVRRLSGYVSESNVAARRFDEHVGFREEARLKGAAPDGGAVLIYVMWKEDCRYV